MKLSAKKLHSVGTFRVEPSILCHPNIPKPLHGVNPRTIYGKEWWDKERQIAYASNNYHCLACGVFKYEAMFHEWLEAHEFYLFDYPLGRVTFDHLVPLCHACHNYIHDGRMEMLLDAGEMTEDKYERIMRHGNRVIKKYNLVNERENRHNHQISASWADWRMIVDGIEYGPSTSSFDDWLDGEWRNWKPSK